MHIKKNRETWILLQDTIVDNWDHVMRMGHKNITHQIEGKGKDQHIRGEKG